MLEFLKDSYRSEYILKFVDSGTLHAAFAVASALSFSMILLRVSIQWKFRLAVVDLLFRSWIYFFNLIKKWIYFNIERRSFRESEKMWQRHFALFSAISIASIIAAHSSGYTENHLYKLLVFIIFSVRYTHNIPTDGVLQLFLPSANIVWEFSLICLLLASVSFFLFELTETLGEVYTVITVFFTKII